MNHTQEANDKRKQTILDRYGPDYWSRIGRKGGENGGPGRGFSADNERAKAAGAKGGKISKRGKAKTIDID